MEKKSLFCELNKGNLFGAQQLFRDEVKINPCHHTLNNLGVFYLYEGLMLGEYKRRNANFLGLCYLNKALKKQCTYQNYFGLGVGNFAINNFHEASQQFGRAFQTKSSYGSLYNLGVTQVSQEKYADASCTLNKCIKLFSEHNRRDTFVAYLYSLSFWNKDLCVNCLRTIDDSCVFSSEMDLFAIAYLCEEYNLAVELCKVMFERWRVDFGVMAMVLNLFLKLGDYKVAESYLAVQVERLKEFRHYNEMKRTYELYDDGVYRQSIVSKYRIKFPIIKENIYFNES